VPPTTSTGGPGLVAPEHDSPRAASRGPTITGLRPRVVSRMLAAVAGMAGALTRSLDRTARISLVGVVLAGVIAVVLGVFITSQTRKDLIVAEQRGLEAAVAAIGDRLPDLDDPLSTAEIGSVHRLVEEAILGGSHVRVKLWAFDGSVRYSDASELIGRRFEDEIPELAALRSDPGVARVSDLSAPENIFEDAHTELVEFYIPVSGRDGEAAGVFEIYSETTELEAALGRIATATWTSIALGLGVLTIFLVALVWSAVRRIERDRAIALESAATSAVLVDAADALATSLDPSQLLERLSTELGEALRLDSLTIEESRSTERGSLGHELNDGSWLVAVRHGEPFAEDERRLLRSVTGSLDAALANAALFARVQQSADERRRLLERLDTAHQEERQAIVGELHDLLAGDLIRLLYGVRGILARSPGVSAAVTQELHALEARVSGAERRLRAFMGRLRPVEVHEDGFLLAMESAVGRARQETGLEIRLRIIGSAGSLPADGRRVLLRTTEEALLNVVKHADARRVLVRLTVTSVARLSIDDDGCGWSHGSGRHAGRGLGLAYARERAESLGGTLACEQSRLGGARLVVELPIKDEG